MKFIFRYIKYFESVSRVKTCGYDESITAVSTP